MKSWVLKKSGAIPQGPRPASSTPVLFLSTSKPTWNYPKQNEETKGQVPEPVSPQHMCMHTHTIKKAQWTRRELGEKAAARQPSGTRGHSKLPPVVLPSFQDDFWRQKPEVRG